MFKTLPKVMALFSRLKNLRATAVDGDEQTTLALDTVDDACWKDGSRSLLLTGDVEGEPIFALIVGGSKAAALLASLGA